MNVSTTTRPVTHVADVDVNKLSKKLVTSPVLEDIGNMSKTVPVNITSANPKATI